MGRRRFGLACARGLFGFVLLGESDRVCSGSHGEATQRVKIQLGNFWGLQRKKSKCEKQRGVEECLYSERVR